MVTATAPASSELFGSGLDVSAAGQLPGDQVLRGLGVDQHGLDPGEAQRRLAHYGPNAVSTHRARLLLVLWHQMRSPLLGLLLVAAVASYFVGQRSDAVIIGVILALSVGLGFVNEYRAEKAAEALHSQIHHQALAIRGGRPVAVDVTALVPGDLVDLRLGDIVPADIRLLHVSGLECDESVLTGESLPVEKTTVPVPAGTALAEPFRLRTDGHRGTRRQRPGGGDRDRGAHPVRGDRRWSGRPPDRDPVPGRTAPVLDAAGLRRRRAHRLDLRHQRGPASADPRRAALLPGHRGRDHPAATARRGVDEPGRRIAANGPPQGAGQTPGLHRGPRRHRHPVHRQDRHPDSGPDQFHARCQRRPRRTARAAAVGSDVYRGHRLRRPCGRRQPPRSGVVGLARRPGKTGIVGRRRPALGPALRPRTAPGLGPGPRRTRQPDDGHQRCAGNRAPTVRGCARYRCRGAGGRVRRREPRRRRRHAPRPRPRRAHPGRRAGPAAGRAAPATTRRPPGASRSSWASIP